MQLTIDTARGRKETVSVGHSEVAAQPQRQDHAVHERIVADHIAIAGHANMLLMQRRRACYWRHAGEVAQVGAWAGAASIRPRRGRTRERARARTRTRAHAHTRTRAHAHTRTRAHAHEHTRTRAHAHARTRTRTHAHTRTRAHVHTRTRAHALTRTRARAH